MLLAIDTCFNGCSAALYDVTADRIVSSRLDVMERGHAERLGPLVADVLAGVGVDKVTRIAVTRGPGTFTGLRIGLAFAKGMALALGVPLVGLDSLTATVAHELDDHKKILVAHAAGATGLFYWAVLDGADGRFVKAPALGSREDFEALGLVRSQSTYPDAKLFAAFAATLPASESVEPLYLREADARPSVANAAPVLRTATLDDCAALSRLHADCFAEGWNEASFSSALSLPGSGALMLEILGTLVGFVNYQWVAGEAEINTVCVSPLYRQQRFGKMLMDGLQQHLHNLKTEKIHLEVSQRNRAALALYETCGFVRSGLRKAYYVNGADAVLMRKDLSS
jgi:tRNA threonylcarbamoyl adenosine modification protein YeaZ/ribosomal-protein-alanine acetyltransferase